jgi:ArsR family transcriptional regulator
MGKRAIPGEEELYELAEFFKILGDLSRVKIINALLISELCVGDLSALLGLGQSAVSHQLRVLKQSGFVKHRREGKLAYYHLADDHIGKIVGQALTHVAEK